MLQKNMDTKKGKKEDGANGWLPAILDGVFGSIQTFVQGTVEGIHNVAHEFTDGLLRKIFLFIFFLVGIVFLFSGMAEMISLAYRRPGAGEIIIGIFVLLITWVVYAFKRR